MSDESIAAMEPHFIEADEVEEALMFFTHETREIGFIRSVVSGAIIDDRGNRHSFEEIQLISGSF